LKDIIDYIVHNFLAFELHFAAIIFSFEIS